MQAAAGMRNEMLGQQDLQKMMKSIFYWEKPFLQTEYGWENSYEEEKQEF